MNDYISVRVDATPCSEDITDLAAAFLADAGFESFEPDESGLTAYIRATEDGITLAEEALADFPIPSDFKISSEFIKGEDWNSEWEKNYFKPIVIGDDRCVIHSSFHTDIPSCEYDIVIDPKMAFGTGHHSTTSLIIGHLLELDFRGKSLLDMGTGTGILAILAAMRGASPVSAIEIDPMAYANAVENVAYNGHPEIDVRLGDATLLSDTDKVDIMLANINRNIILADIDRYISALKQGGRLYLSGFYVNDVPMIEAKAHPLGLKTVSVRDLNDWCCLEMEMTI